MTLEEEIIDIKKKISELREGMVTLIKEITEGFKTFTKAFTEAINPSEQQSRPLKDDCRGFYL